MTMPPEKPVAKRHSANSDEKIPEKYGKLTEPERWEWHANHYAFRRVYLGVPDHVRTWDGDPDGKYFDAEMVERETERLRAKLVRQRGAAPQPKWSERDPRNDPYVQSVRARWCRLKGYSSWERFLDDIEQGRTTSKEFVHWCLAQNIADSQHSVAAE